MQARVGQHPNYKDSKLYHLIEDLYAIVQKCQPSKSPKIQKQFKLLLKQLSGLHDIFDKFSGGRTPGYLDMGAIALKVPGIIKETELLDFSMIIENLPIDAQIEIFELIKGQGSLEDLLSFIDPDIPQKNLKTIQNISWVAGGRSVKSIEHKLKDNKKLHYKIEFEDKSPNLELDLNEHYQEMKEMMGAGILKNIRDKFKKEISQIKDLEDMASHFMVIEVCEQTKKKVLTIIEGGVGDQEGVLLDIYGEQQPRLEEIFKELKSNFQMIDKSQDFLSNKIKKLEAELSKIEQLYKIFTPDEIPAEFKGLESEIREIIKAAEEHIANLIKEQEEKSELKREDLKENIEKIESLQLLLNDQLFSRGSYHEKLESIKKILESNGQFFSEDQVQQIRAVLSKASKADIPGTVDMVIQDALRNMHQEFSSAEEKIGIEILIEKTEKIRALYDRLNEALAGHERYDEKSESIKAILDEGSQTLSEDQVRQIMTALDEVSEAEIWKVVGAVISSALRNIQQEEYKREEKIKFLGDCKRISSDFNEISKSWKGLKEKFSEGQNANVLNVSECGYLLGLDIPKIKTKVDELEDQMMLLCWADQEEDETHESFKELFAGIRRDIKNFEDVLIQGYVKKTHESDIEYLQKAFLSPSKGDRIEYNEIMENVSEWNKKIIEENAGEEKEGFFDNSLFKARDLASKNKKNIALKLKDFIANPCWNELYKAIIDMHNHGVKILEEGQKNSNEENTRLGIEFVQFSRELIRKDIVNYLASSNKDLEEFCNDCAAKLEGKLQEKSTSQHRKAWKVYLGNIAVALIPLGLVFFAVRAVCGAFTGSPVCFFTKTKRQKQIVKAKQVVEKLNPKSKHHQRAHVQEQKVPKSSSR